jgi:hypothetical protein
MQAENLPRHLRIEHIAMHVLAGMGSWTPNFTATEVIPYGSPAWMVLSHKVRAEYAVAAAKALVEELDK